MNRIVAILIVLITAQTTLAQTQADVIKRANYLVANKRYESAFKLLVNFDSNNSNPDIVLLKEDFALNYYVASSLHRSFAFRDIAWNDDIMDYRNKSSYSNLYSFPINKILDDLIKSNPDNYRLYNGLGDYYANVELTYDDKWLVSVDSLHQLIKKNYEIAVAHNAGNDFSNYEIGYVDIVQQNYADAIPYLLKSIALNKDNPDAYYNLAYAYLNTDDKENALKNAKVSFHLFDDSISKGDAARMMGEIYADLKDTSNAIKNYELSDEVDTANYYTLQPLLYLYVKTNSRKAKWLLDEYFNLDPENPTIYNDLNDIYTDGKKVPVLIDYYKVKLNEIKDDDIIIGNLNFYLGMLYMSIDKVISRDYFMKAKITFKLVYSDDNEVFKAIEEQLSNSQK